MTSFSDLIKQFVIQDVPYYLNNILLDEVRVNLSILVRHVDQTVQWKAAVDSIYSEVVVFEMVFMLDDPSMENLFQKAFNEFRFNHFNDLDIYLYRLLNQSVPECYICLDVTNHRLPCNHSICYRCMYKVLNQMQLFKCGCCQTVFDYHSNTGSWIRYTTDGRHQEEEGETSDTETIPEH